MMACTHQALLMTMWCKAELFPSELEEQAEGLKQPSELPTTVSGLKASAPAAVVEAAVRTSVTTPAQALTTGKPLVQLWYTAQVAMFQHVSIGTGPQADRCKAVMTFKGVLT